MVKPSNQNRQEMTKKKKFSTHQKKIKAFCDIVINYKTIPAKGGSMIGGILINLNLDEVHGISLKSLK